MTKYSDSIRRIQRYPLFKLLLFVFIGNLIVHGEPTYGPWGEWSDCDVSEGQGMMTRKRECVATNCPQPGEYRDEMRCFVKPCNCECAGEVSNKIPAASKLHQSPSPFPPWGSLLDKHFYGEAPPGGPAPYTFI